MKLVALEDTELTLPQLADLAKSETVILTRKGKPLAAVKDLSGSDWESVSLASNPQFLALIEGSRRAYQEQGGISLEELRAELRGKRKTRRPIHPRKKA